MADLKAEYASMDAAARHLRAAVSDLPAAIARFEQATGLAEGFGNLPEAVRAKHTVEESMGQLGRFADDLHAEWLSEASALTAIAGVLHRVDDLLAREAKGMR